MTGPIPVRPQEPRWYVSVNGSVEGPYGQAYIVACLSAGQIPTGALLCLEGATQWQPLSAWPQFMVARPPPPPPPSGLQFSSSPTQTSPRATSIPQDLQTFATYAKVVSPVILLAWGSLFIWDFDPNVNTYAELISAIVIVGMEAVPRGLAAIGTFSLTVSPSRAAIWFLVGALGLVAFLGLKLAVVLIGILFMTEASGPPRPVYVVGNFIFLINAGELLYLFLSLFTLLQASKRLR